MKKLFALIMAVIMAFTMAACGGNSTKPEVINSFDQLDTSKFHGGLSGDGYFLVMYEGVIDEAVMGAVLTAEDGSNVTLSEATIVKNPDGNSLLFFEQYKAEQNDTVQLTLEKERYDTISFEVTVE